MYVVHGHGRPTMQRKMEELFKAGKRDETTPAKSQIRNMKQ